MSWLYSRALVEGSLVASCLDGAQFALWSAINTQQQPSPNDKTTGIWRHSRYGMTYKPLTDDLGEAVLMSYLADSPARTSALLGKAQGSTASDQACGGTWHESSMKYDRDLHSWKTHRHLFDEVLPESSVILPKSGMIADGVLWEQTTPERRTVENESGFWPTPCSQMSQRKTVDGQNLSKKGVRYGLSLVQKVKIWPTPTAHNGSEMDSPAEKTRNTPSLTHQARGGDTTLPTRLNPDWVEWLMGWPIGWTDLKPLAMAKFRRWLQQHSSF